MLSDSIFTLETTDYLQNEYLERRKRNPRYSMRAFARDLDLSASTLCEFLNGKASLSPDRAADIGRKLDLSDLQIEHFCDLLTLHSGASEDRKREARRSIERRFERQKSYLPLEKFAVVSSWYHMVILELIDLNPKYHSAGQLAETLDLEEKQVARALEELIAVGLLRRNEARLETVLDQTLVGNEQESGAIRAYHRQTLEQSLRALMELPVNRRNFQSIVFSIRAGDAAAFNKELETAVKTLVDKYDSKAGKDLACSLNVQWLPHNQDVL